MSIRAADTPDDTVDLLCELVRHPTTAPGAAMDAAFEALRGHLDARGVESELLHVGPGAHPIARARVVGAEPGPAILLQGHMDVVPADAGWARDPFAPTVHDGHVHGRGSADMKAGLAAFATAMASLRRDGLRRGSVTLLVGSDEETGSDGCLLPYIAEHGLDANWAVCAEPTGLRPYLGNRGLVWMRVEARGRAAHAGMPAGGRNPIPAIAAVVRALPAPPALVSPYGSSPPSLTPTTLTAGTALNSIPDTAAVTIDRRLVPGEDPAAVVADLERAVVAAAGAQDGVRVTCTCIKSWPPCLLDERSPLAAAARRTARRHGYDDRFGFDDACNDASFLAEAGVPTLIWGPGAPEAAHTSQERVAVRQVLDAAAMYRELVAALTEER